MSVVALVIAPSIALQSDAVTAYVEGQINGTQTIELVVPATETEEAVAVKISSEEVENQWTVQVSTKAVDSQELHRDVQGTTKK